MQLLTDATRVGVMGKNVGSDASTIVIGKSLPTGAVVLHFVYVQVA